MRVSIKSSWSQIRTRRRQSRFGACFPWQDPTTATIISRRLAATCTSNNFKLAGNKEAARKEWADLKEVAGTGRIVAFGSRYDPQARLRKADERPENPDPYSTNIGLQEVRGRTDWPPVRALLDYKD